MLQQDITEVAGDCITVLSPPPTTPTPTPSTSNKPQQTMVLEAKIDGQTCSQDAMFRLGEDLKRIRDFLSSAVDLFGDSKDRFSTDKQFTDLYDRVFKNRSWSEFVKGAISGMLEWELPHPSINCDQEKCASFATRQNTSQADVSAFYADATGLTMCDTYFERSWTSNSCKRPFDGRLEELLYHIAVQALKSYGNWASEIYWNH